MFFYISRVFSNFRSVLSRCNTRLCLRSLHLLSDTDFTRPEQIQQSTDRQTDAKFIPISNFGFEFWVDNSATSLSFYGYFNCLQRGDSFVIVRFERFERFERTDCQLISEREIQNRRYYFFLIFFLTVVKNQFTTKTTLPGVGK